MNLKLNPRQPGDYRTYCTHECGKRGHNCIEICIAGIVLQVRELDHTIDDYEPNRNAASSHPCPSSILFFSFPVDLTKRKSPGEGPPRRSRATTESLKPYKDRRPANRNTGHGAGHRPVEHTSKKAGATRPSSNKKPNRGRRIKPNL